MLSVEADILALDLDSLRLLRSYREAGLNARAERAKAVAAEAKAAEHEAAAGSADPPDLTAGEQPAELMDQPDATKAAKPERDKGDPWVERIAELEFVEPEELSEIHGKLIAAGFLNFQIRNRQTGVEYRITNAGKQFLTRAVEEANDMADSREFQDQPISLPDGADADPGVREDTVNFISMTQSGGQTEAA